jgi:hypothetical protein
MVSLIKSVFIFCIYKNIKIDTGLSFKPWTKVPDKGAVNWRARDAEEGYNLKYTLIFLFFIAYLSLPFFPSPSPLPYPLSPSPKGIGDRGCFFPLPLWG